MKRIINFLRARHQARKDVVYYDNYTLFGSIMGGYCGLLKFSDRKR